MNHDRCCFASWACRLAALVCLAGLGLSASAQTYTANAYLTSMEPLAGGGFKRVSVGAAGQDLAGLARTYGMTVGGDVAITDAVSLAGRAGALNVSVPATIAAVDAVGAIAAVLATGPGAVVVGTGVAAIVAARVYRDGGLHWDQGQPPEVQQVYICGQGGANESSGPTPSQACSMFYKKLEDQTSPAQRPGWLTITLGTCSTPSGGGTGNCTAVRRYFNDAGSQYAQDTPNVSYSRGQATACPAVIDASNPAYSVPAGTPQGPDGKCRSGRYNHIDMTPEQAAAKVMEKPPAGLGDQLRQGLKDMWSPTPREGSGITPKPDQSVKVTPGPGSITGPTSQPGQPGTTTTTGPSGTTTTTVTPQYNYTYSPTTITYNTSNTTVTVNPDGTSTTTTTNPPAPTPQDPNDPCTQHPDTVGCMKLGDVPTDKVPTRDANVSYVPETVSLPSGCPADQVIEGKAFSYAMICDTATNARPWVLVGAAFSALMLLVAAIRTI